MSDRPEPEEPDAVAAVGAGLASIDEVGSALVEGDPLELILGESAAADGPVAGTLLRPMSVGGQRLESSQGDG